MENKMDIRLSMKVCEDFLRNTIVPYQKVLDYDITYMEENEERLCIKIFTEDDEYNIVARVANTEEEYVSHGLSFHQLQDTLFVIEDIFIKGYSKLGPADLGVLHLKSILKSLALNHAKCISQGFTEGTRYILLKNQYESLFSFIDNNTTRFSDSCAFKNSIENLVYSSQEILEPKEGNIYVQSYILQDKLFFKNIHNEAVDCKIVNTTSTIQLPFIYDMLMALFSFSDQKSRQHHFHGLIKYYYKNLKENCNDLDIDLTTILTLEEFQNRVVRFLPLVKLELTRYYCEKLNESEDLLWTAISELYEYFLYPNLTREDCYKVLGRKIGSSDSLMLNWTLLPAEKDFDLKINVREGNEDVTLNFRTKHLSQIEEIYFKKEVFYYETIMAHIRSLGLEKIANFCPTCHLARFDEVLVLEDVSSMDYKPLDEDESVSYESLQLVVKQLAKLHASSLLCEEIMSEKTGNIFRFSHYYQEYLQDSDFESESSLIAQIENTCVSYKKSPTSRSVISHGNLHRANILFKRDDNDMPIECCLVNYQMIKYCPPFFDLLLLLYLNTDRDTRTKHMSQLIEDYYKELSLIFKNYGFDLNKIYTYKQLLDEVANQEPFGNLSCFL